MRQSAWRKDWPVGRPIPVVEQIDSRKQEDIEALSLQEALKRGHFLAGCLVYLGGFLTTHIEKLGQVLRVGGTSKLNQLTESVTHVLLPSPIAEHLKAMHGWATKPYIVSLCRIAKSIQPKHLADESNFLIQLKAD